MSNFGFFILNSQSHESDSCQSCDLITGLPALKSEDLTESNISPLSGCDVLSVTMSERQVKKKPNPFVSTTESENESKEYPLELVADTVSDNSDSQSKGESNKNVTVLERVISTLGTDIPLVSTPAEHIGSLHLSAQPMLVPETMDSLDEIAPSPNAFDRAPVIIPDSPTLDDKDDPDDDDSNAGIASFKLVIPTMDSKSISYTETELSQNRAESQNLCLQFTPSQADNADSDDAESGYKPKGYDAKKAEASPLKGDDAKKARESPLKLRGHDRIVTVQSSDSKPSFHLQKPTLSADVESDDETEGSVSVFKRVKSGNRTPQKQIVIRDDSEEFLPVAGSSKRSLLHQKKHEIIVSPSKKLEKSSKPASKPSGPLTAGDKCAIDVDAFRDPQKSSNKLDEQLDLVEVDDGLASGKKEKGKPDELRVGFAQTTLVINEEPESQPLDENETLSYEYHHGDSRSHNAPDQSESIRTRQILEKQVATSSSDEFINPSQKRNPGRKKESSPAQSEEEVITFDLSGDEPTACDAGKEKHVITSPASEVSSSKLGKQKAAMTVNSASTFSDKSGSHKNKTPIKQTALLSYRTSAQVENVDDQHFETSRFTSVSCVPTSTVTCHTKNKIPDASSVVENTPSEGSTVKHSRSLDPYIFIGSQSQNIADVSALPSSSRPPTHLTSATGKARAVKFLKKVLRKRNPSKTEEGNVSTSDSPGTGNQPPKPRAARKKQQKEGSQEQQSIQQARVQDVGFTLLQKPHFSRPVNPPPPKADSSFHNEPVKTHTSEKQMFNEGKVHSEVGESSRQSKKYATVSFSDAVQKEPPTLLQNLSDSSDHEVERTTVEQIQIVTTIVLEKTKTEVYNAKGKLIRFSESNPKVVKQTTAEPILTLLPDQTRERIISPQESPSRSTSTVNTGDLADVSSFSLSRTNSTGSKTSNPSLDPIPPSQGQPTSAQKQHSLEKHDKEGLPQSLENRTDADSTTVHGVNASSKIEQKRLSAGSSTGQDLFSTPNQSVIDRADSQIGKVISSSNSTPGSCPMVSLNTNASTAGQIQTHDSCNTDQSLPVKVTSLHQAVVAHSSVTSSLPMAEQCKMVSDHARSGSIVETQPTPADKSSDPKVHIDTPQRQTLGHSLVGKRLLSDNDENSAQEEEISPSAKFSDKKRKLENLSRGRGSQSESTDVQSTGFSVHGVTLSATSRGSILAVPSSKSSGGFSPEISLQGGSFKNQADTVILTNFKSKVETGAKVMGKWKDGFYYPGVLSNVDKGNTKYMVKFDDGSQQAVKARNIILAAEIPVGQSVMVFTTKDYYVPGMIIGHSRKAEHLVYHIERDDGVTQKCNRESLILTEDQAACLLSDEELRITPDAVSISTSKPSDISLDNLVAGKRQSKKSKTVSHMDDQPSTSGLRASTTLSKKNSSEELTRTGRKRKIGPVATSTPTPKQLCKDRKDKDTPVKASIPSPLGGVVASPSESRRSPRKARIGLFDSRKNKLFEGMTFLLTHVEKTAEQRADEKRQLRDFSSLDTSAEDNTDIESAALPFVKDHIVNMIEKGGGAVLHSFDLNNLPVKENCYLVAAEHQRTIKYLQALAAGMTIVSHQWIIDSVMEHELQGLKAYILPAGISLQKKKFMERTKGCPGLLKQTAMIVSTNQEFVETWSSILTIAGCHIVSRFPTRASKNDPGVDVVVSDKTCPVTIVRRCRQLEVPLMSSEWVAQCLINGHLVDVKGHDKYRHDFLE